MVHTVETQCEKPAKQCEKPAHKLINEGYHALLLGMFKRVMHSMYFNRLVMKGLVMMVEIKQL